MKILKKIKWKEGINWNVLTEPVNSIILVIILNNIKIKKEKKLKKEIYKLFNY